jgi:creatinine amidohydrolase/Fe(II)-dependent formamide hydrolase-like protein
MVLRLAPRLVGEIRSLDPVAPGNAFEPAWRAWITKDRSALGHIGDPREATAEKGEGLFQAYADGVVGLIERAIGWNGRDWEG